MIKKFIYIFVYICIFTITAFTIEKYVDFGLIKQASNPRFVEEGVLITLPKDYGYSVFLRCNLDNWKENHYFKTSDYGIFYVILPYDPDKEELLYKINVNGFWETDPNNPEKREDKYGTEISVLKIPDKSDFQKENPIIRDIEKDYKEVRLRYYNPDAQEVNLVCSVYNMSYFSNPMIKQANGYWEIVIYLKPGEYYYFFYVDGKKIIDMANEEKRWHQAYDGMLSYFIIE